LNGLLTSDGRVLFPNPKAIVISEAAVESFRAEPHLVQFRPLLRPIRDGEHVAERLRAVALPGHAPGHTGYAFDTEDDRFLFFGDVVHVPALQFANPAFSWGFDDDQPTARATRLRVFQDTVATGTWIAGAHLGRPGIGLHKTADVGDRRAFHPRPVQHPTAIRRGQPVGCAHGTR
jgi:glyoxylase-like metal-dependent hydrolase (beta-lactamase superfamily II)